MRILILTERFPPEVRSAAHLFHDLARELQRHGHETAVITTVPSRYVAACPGFCVAPGWGDVSGVRTLRVKGLPLTSSHPAARGLDHLALGWRFGRASLKWPNADVVLVYSPPLPLASGGMKYQRRFGAPVVLNVQDIYPQTAIELESMDYLVEGVLGQ